MVQTWGRYRSLSRSCLFGYALVEASFPLFQYVVPSLLYAITPSIGHAGSIVDIEMSSLGADVMPLVRLGGTSCTSVQTKQHENSSTQQQT